MTSNLMTSNLMTSDLAQIDEINRRTWCAPSSLRLYKKAEGYTDIAEERIFRELAKDYAGKRILDIGMGGGRTTGILTKFTDAYVGIDYTAEMVEAASSRFPGRTFLHMDARDMSCFDDKSFDAVVFSCNGIDSVGPQGRLQVLKECARILAPNGVLFFSSFNRNGNGFGQRVNNRKIALSKNPVRFAYDLAKYIVGGLIGYARIARYGGLEKHSENHSLLLHRAHDFGIFVYATTVSDIRAQLQEAGLDADCEILGCSGQAMLDDQTARDEYFQILTRRPADRQSISDSHVALAEHA